MLEEVNDNLIGRIKEITQVEQEPDDIESILKYREKYFKFKKLFSDTELFSDRFTIHTETIGLPFEVYLNYYISEVRGKEHTVETIGVDMIGMCLLSSTEGLVQNIVKDNLPKVNNDVDFIIKVNIFVNNILNEMVKNG